MNNIQYVSSHGANLWTNSSYRGSNSSHEITYMLMASGGPGYEYYLAPVTNMVNDLVHVVSFEQRVCGHSDPTPPYDFQTVIEDIETIRKQYNISKWIIAGHSWGATIAIAYSLYYPSNVEGIIYLAGIGVQNNREWHKQFQDSKSKYPDPLPGMKFPFNEEVNKEGNQSWRKYIQNRSEEHTSELQSH